MSWEYVGEMLIAGCWLALAGRCWIGAVRLALFGGRTRKTTWWDATVGVALERLAAKEDGDDDD